MKRFGILTGGGDCPGLNAVLRAVGKTLQGMGHELVGFEDGFLGVMQRRYRVLSNADLSGILNLGGTIIGTSNRDNPFHWPAGSSQPGAPAPADHSQEVAELVGQLGLEGLIVIGGDGSLSIAYRLMSERGVPCIGVPKTIDNDLSATDLTFGFDTAVQTATDCLDRLHSTAMSHHRVMVVELMGRYAGWLTLYAGVAGGGDVILIPEIPYRLEAVCRRILERSKTGKRFSIVAASEGARPEGGEMVVDKMVPESHDPVRLGGIGKVLAGEIEQQTGLESRVTVLGHLQRGGSPTAVDRLLGTEFGSMAARLAVSGSWGQMVSYQGGRFASVSLESAVSKLKLVEPDYPLVQAARLLGTSFGDEPE